MEIQGGRRMNRFTFWVITKMTALSHRILYKYNDDYKKWRDSDFIKTRDETRKRMADMHGVTSVKMHVYPSLYNSDIPVFHQGGFVPKDKILSFDGHHSYILKPVEEDE